MTRLLASALLLLATFLIPAHAEKAGNGAGSVPPGFTAIGAATDPISRLPMRIRHDATGYELVFVPAGSFTMGAAENDPKMDECEMPQKTVFVPGFWIGRTEISNAQFRLFNSKHRSGEYRGLTLDQDSQPVVNVSWEEAVAFCRWAGMRLPIEAEWEKAARGTDRRHYAWGNEMPPTRRVANIADSFVFRFFNQIPTVNAYFDGYFVTAPVGAFPDGASPCGALDMTGNVDEWCQDGWDERMWHFITQVMDVDEEDGRAHRIYRGGSFFSGSTTLRVEKRGSYPLDCREKEVGFRAAVSPISDGGRAR